MQKSDFELVGISQLPIGEVIGFEKFLAELGFDNPKFIRYVDTVDDLRAGERHELVKLKPYMGLINESKIQLFNAKDGRLEVEAISHNIMASQIAKLAFLDWYYTRLSMGQSNWSVGNFIGKMKLSDWGGDESAAMQFMLGKCIGAYGQGTYIGIGAAFLGTLNTGESDYQDTARAGVRKYVIDFATNAANGIIRSIWFGTVSDYYYNYANMLKPVMSLSSAAGNIANLRAFCVSGNKLFTVVSGAPADIVRRVPGTFAAEATLTLSGQTVYSIGWDRGSYLYAITYSSTTPNYRLYKIDLATFASVGYVEIPTVQTSYGVAYFNSKIYCFKSSSEIYEIDPATGSVTATKTQTELGLASQSFYFLTATDEDLFLFQCNSSGDGRISSFDASWNRRVAGMQDATEGLNTQELNIGTSGYRFHFLPSTYPIQPGAIIHYSNQFFYKRFQEAVCHTKLASDVEKTNANTMKVTYQFNVALPF